MPAVNTTGSTNIATLDSRVIADLCEGKFYVDVTPSVYIGAGEASVLGANVRITNPHNVVIKEYGDNYEIAPDLSGEMDAQISFNIPKLAGGYVTGRYKVEVILYDGSLSWTVEKYVDVCAPDSSNKLRTYKNLSADLRADCKNGKLYVIVDGVPNYKGKTVQSQVNSFTLSYPTSSGVADLVTSNGAFAVTLYEGVYKITGEICATYNMGDNVYAKVKYKIKKEKQIRCLLDECCVFERLKELDAKLQSDCTDAERESTTATILDTLRLLKTAQVAAECGQDPSDYITALEELLGCTCTCNCAEGTPVIDNTPVSDMRVEGCLVEQSTDGLTTVYTINAKTYTLGINDNGGVLTITAATEDGCEVSQQLTFNLLTLYTQLKTLANANNTEADFWASVVNKSLAGVTITCVDGVDWDNLTLKQKIQAIWTALCACCASCTGSVSITSTESVGNDVKVTWSVTGVVDTVDAYMDGEFVGSVLGDEHTDFTFPGAADGAEHTYTLIAKNSSGKVCMKTSVTATYLGCAYVAPPALMANEFNETCPFDFETIIGTLVTIEGIEYEVHNVSSNPSASSLLNASALTGGSYYLYAKNADGCYSVGVYFEIICESETSCTAPQNLTVEKITGGNLVKFQSAAYPPSSYTVKRKLASDPDVDGSYTTIGTPVWNSTLSRWVITDTTATDNILYTYAAVSNCGASPSDPKITAEFANINCPSLTLTPSTGDTGGEVEYSFEPIGGDIDKYEVKIYNEAGNVLIDYDTHVPIFPDPIGGLFDYLTEGLTYKVGIVVYIGIFSKICPLQSVTIDAP